MFKFLKSPKGVATLGIGAVFAFAVYISAKHIIHVALYYGQTADIAYPLPVIVDLFALFCAIKRRNTQSGIQRKLTATGMWGMLLTSLWFNVESALITNIDLVGIPLAKAIFISSLAAVVVAGAAEILTHTRSVPRSSSSSKAKAEPKPANPAKAPGKPAAKRTPAKVTAPRQRKAPAVETVTEVPVAS